MPTPISWGTIGGLGVKAVLWIRDKLSVCKVSIGTDWKNGAIEDGVRWIHVPVTVKSNWFGAMPVVDAEVDVTDSPFGTMPLFWQNRADTDKPERKMTLRPGDYLIPFAARTTQPTFPLSARAVTSIPKPLYQSWVLKRGVVRITNSAHYFTFVDLLDLCRSDIYPFTISIRNQAGKIVAERTVRLAVPESNADNKYFYVT